MDEINEVFILTRGCYSDYRIVGVFSSEEKLNEYVKAFDCHSSSYGTGFNEMEKFTLDPHIEDLRAGKLFPFTVGMYEDGELLSMEEFPSYFREGKFNYYAASSHGPKKSYIFRDCLAIDSTHAIKITNELRAMAIANGTWGINNK
jgi:hypothetical protein